MAGTPFQNWALLELMWHRQVPGMVEEVELAGEKFLRVRVPNLKRDPAGLVVGLDVEDVRLEQYYSPSSVYALTPTTEETVARLLAREAAYLPLLPPPGSTLRPEDLDEDSSTGGPDDGAEGPSPARSLADLAEAVAGDEDAEGDVAP